MNVAAVEKMKTPRDVVVEWIDHILDRKKWTGTDLARNSELAPSTILRLLNDPDHQFIPSLKTLQKIAVGSGYAIPRKVTDALGAGRMEAAEPGTEDEGDSRRSRPSRAATVELRHVSSLPKALQSAANSKREMYAPAPPQLEGDETAFAFYMPDDSFDPWIKTGMLIYATKRRDPVTNDTIMITGKDGKTRVRLLMGMDEEGMRLSKSMPAKVDETVNYDDIEEIAIVAIFVKI